MSFLPSFPGDAVAAVGGAMGTALGVLWRASRSDCKKQIAALQGRVSALENKVTELQERLIAEVRARG